MPAGNEAFTGRRFSWYSGPPSFSTAPTARSQACGKFDAASLANFGGSSEKYRLDYFVKFLLLTSAYKGCHLL